jgi:hypothetical protein
MQFLEEEEYRKWWFGFDDVRLQIDRTTQTVSDGN